MRLRHPLLALVPIVWLGFAYGLWQRRRRLWVSWRARPSTLADVGAALWGSVTVMLITLLVWGIGFRQITQVYDLPSADFLRLTPDKGIVLPPVAQDTSPFVIAGMPVTGAGTGTVTSDMSPRLSTYRISAFTADAQGHLTKVVTGDALLVPNIIRYTHDGDHILYNAGLQPVRCSGNGAPLSPTQGVLLQPHESLILSPAHADTPLRCLAVQLGTASPP